MRSKDLKNIGLCSLCLTSSLALATTCEDGYSICSPPGATSSITPQIGSSDFPSLFTDIVESFLPPSSEARKRSLKRDAASLCCNAQLSCLTLANLAIPFCYDRFTTNYFLPDGSFGTVVGGEYTSGNGDVANLETGEYALVDGQKGNIYSAGLSAPDTRTLPMPSQFTATGVGSVVPAHALGNEVTRTYTTTLPASTQLGTTVPASTASSTTTVTILLPATSAGRLVVVTELSLTTVARTVAGTTVAGSTVPGVVTVVTTTEHGAPSSTTVATATERSEAGREKEMGGLWVLGVLLLVHFVW